MLIIYFVQHSNNKNDFTSLTSIYIYIYILSNKLVKRIEIKNKIIIIIMFTNNLN